MRPIDADRLLQELEKLKTDGGIFTEEEYYAEDVENLIRNSPVVRIRPNVRTGRWAPSAYQDGTDTKYLECTNCREIMATISITISSARTAAQTCARGSNPGDRIGSRGRKRKKRNPKQRIRRKCSLESPCGTCAAVLHEGQTTKSPPL